MGMEHVYHVHGLQTRPGHISGEASYIENEPLAKIFTPAIYCLHGDPANVVLWHYLKVGDHRSGVHLEDRSNL